jgi:ethanolamine utilization protein EutA
MKKQILSVGIDIGTSTTILVFSHIFIENVAQSHRVADAKIVGKEIVYRSPVHITPLISNSELDAEGIALIVREEYRGAGIDPSEVQTGAVIITGDTARKSNAEKVLHRISGYAGDFVVATAGPELESILAGKGSGAEQFSIDTVKTITNLDVGGGTTNIAVFRDGAVVDVDCMDVGGRLIRFRPGTSEVEYIFPKIKQLAIECDIPVDVGTTLGLNQMRTIARAMAEAVFCRFAEGSAGAPTESFTDEKYLFLRTNGRAEKTSGYVPARTDVISFSGGVGDLIYADDLPPLGAFDDIGVILAQEMKSIAAERGLAVTKPSETMGATVVGAGSHSIEISGSTVTLTPGDTILPLKNIPIIKAKYAGDVDSRTFEETVRNNIAWIKGGDEVGDAALAVDCDRGMSFRQIGQLADLILSAMPDVVNRRKLLIVILNEDFGKVLGQSLRSRLQGDKDKNVLCIDGVNVQNGDYIDIGRPVGVGDALPIVIKTLTFSC